MARFHFLHPRELEQKTAEGLQTRGFSRAYWLYVAAGALITAGFADFSLIAFHFQQERSVPIALIPVWYAVAMAAGALSALVFDRLLDCVGFAMVLLAFFLSALFAPAEPSLLPARRVSDLTLARLGRARFNQA